MKKLLFIGLISLTLSACHSGSTHNSSSGSKWETREVYSSPKIDNANATTPEQNNIFSQSKVEKSVGKQKAKTTSTKVKKKAGASQPTKKRYRNLSGCDCGYSYCYGPRGGRYCITSGGNKSYR